MTGHVTQSNRLLFGVCPVTVHLDQRLVMTTEAEKLNKCEVANFTNQTRRQKRSKLTHTCIARKLPSLQKYPYSHIHTEITLISQS